jgi:hypothetical protein
MAAIVRWGRQLFLRSPSLPRSFPKAGFKILDNAHNIEEEKYAWYQPENSYPVRIGEIFKSTYQVLSKLGYGAYSTVWLCRNLKYAFAHNVLMQLTAWQPELIFMSR